MAAAAEQAPQQRQTPSCARLLDHGGAHHHAQTAPCCASRSRDTARRETGVFPNAPKKRRFWPRLGARRGALETSLSCVLARTSATTPAAANPPPAPVRIRPRSTVSRATTGTPVRQLTCAQAAYASPAR